MTRIVWFFLSSLFFIVILPVNGSVTGEFVERGQSFFIDFEDYPVGVPPGDPWEYSSGVEHATISGPAYAGQNALGLVSNYSFFNPRLSYPISITQEDGNVVISVKVRPPNYAPGASGDGFVTLASFLTIVDQGQYNPGVIFDLRKPFGSQVQPSHYIIRTKGGFWTGIGTFLPGQYHDVTTTFDWQAGMAETVITRPDGISYTESWSIDFSELQQLAFTGGSSIFPPATQLAMFDDIAVIMQDNGLQDHEILENVTLADGEHACFDALQTITASDFTVQAGGSATLIAGESIHLLPGTTVEHGGYLHALIAANEEDYCGSPRSGEIAKEVVASTEAVVSADLPYENSENDFFNLYPNPTDGMFTLEFTNEMADQGITLEVHDMLGERLLSQKLPPQRLHTLSLEGRQSGIYIIRVIKGNEMGVKRLIKR